MSLTSKQIDELREYAKDRKGELAKMIKEAADTIESLSAKLSAANLERSSQYYHNGWIPCSERLPEDGTWCLFTDGENMSVERYKADAIDAFFPTGRWFDLDDAVAWMPLPKPWKGGQDG